MPTVIEALKLGEQSLQAGDPAQAAYIYQQILRAVPDEPRALCGLGVVAIHTDRLDEAEEYLRRAIEIWPNDPVFHNNLSEVYRRREQWDEAIACSRRALALAPHEAQLHSNLGVLEKRRGDHAAALVSLHKAVELDPQAGHLHYNLANLYSLTHRLADAEPSFRRALALEPDDPDIHNNLANVLEVEGRWDEALVHLNTALALREDFADAHRNRALVRLLQGDFAQGWPEYEWRWRVAGTVSPDFPQPRWHGEDLDGRTILLCAEQGLGDTLQFIRYAELVRQRGARTILQCPGLLHPLLGRTPGIDRFAAAEGSLESFDLYVPLMSLPACFGTTLDSIPAPIPYLFADPDRVARLGQRLPATGKLKVGIAWQGSRGFGGDRWRSVPLAHLAPLAHVEGVQLFNLQRGDGREQMARVAADWGVIDWMDELDAEGAFVDTAALMMHLDLVITTDTAIAHLAGGLGAPVWVALQYSPNWRWLLGRSDSPWYPGMKLFRQKRFDDWSGVFEQMADDLRTLAAQHASR